MTTLLDALLDELAADPAALERLRGLVGASATTPWLSAAQAAEHLACPISRVRKLTMTGELPVTRDGRRTLYRRDDLDAYLRNGGAVSP